MEVVNVFKNGGCDFCKEIVNIEPAKSVACDGTDKEQVEFLEKAKREKKFLWFTNEYVAIVDKCPVCGHEFTEEDYDNYEY